MLILIFLIGQLMFKRDCLAIDFYLKECVQTLMTSPTSKGNQQTRWGYSALNPNGSVGVPVTFVHVTCGRTNGLMLEGISSPQMRTKKHNKWLCASSCISVAFDESFHSHMPTVNITSLHEVSFFYLIAAVRFILLSPRLLLASPLRA